jgi:NADPH2:quinone reductase
MRVAQFSEFGGPEMLRIEEVPEPTPGAGEIVIRVAAVGLNFFDTLVLRNRYQVTPTLPHSPGAEVAGTIEAVGPDVSSLKPGQRVVAFIGGNGAREKVATKARNAVPIPDGVSDEAAASDGINYQDEDLKSRLKELTGGRGVDVLYDCVGGPYAEPALRAMAWEGRYLVVGFAAGEIPRFPLNVVMLKGCSVIGVSWSAFVERNPDQHRANMVELLEWCRQGLIVPHIHGTFPLAETAKALCLIEGRKATGKVIVNPQL